MVSTASANCRHTIKLIDKLDFGLAREERSKPDFELFLPRHLAKRAIPFLAVVTTIGTLLLAWRVL